MTRVAIQVENGKVTITLGGQSAPVAATGPVVDDGTVGEVKDGVLGGEGAGEGTETGGGGPGSGCLVIGPIVIPVSLSSGAGSATGGEGAGEGTETGGGGPGGSDCVVIGPIVFCGKSGSASAPSAKPVDVNPA